MSRTAVAIVSSTRAANGTYADQTGPVIVEWLRAHGFETQDAVVVADGPDVGAALRLAIDAGASLVVTTGGTGVGAGDVTAELTAALLTAELPGFGEELRRRGSVNTPFAILSRGTAGLAGRTFIVNLPGSSGGVRDGLQLLGEVVDHVLDQVEGGTHD
jgi:molybdenum cofactor synthesis domain-containing protein